LLWLFHGSSQKGEGLKNFVTRLSLHRSLIFKGLRGMNLIDGGTASEKRTKFRVKFLKKTSRGTLVECGEKVTTVRGDLKKIPVGEILGQGQRTVASEVPVRGAERR
jgi:hypothetical protein